MRMFKRRTRDDPDAATTDDRGAYRTEQYLN